MSFWTCPPAFGGFQNLLSLFHNTACNRDAETRQPCGIAMEFSITTAYIILSSKTKTNLVFWNVSSGVGRVLMMHFKKLFIGLYWNLGIKKSHQIFDDLIEKFFSEPLCEHATLNMLTENYTINIDERRCCNILFS